MIRVKDEAGNIVEGIFKDSLGNIIFKRGAEYSKYVRQQDVINRLTDKISILSNSVNQLEMLVRALTKDKE